MRSTEDYDSSAVVKKELGLVQLGNGNKTISKVNNNNGNIFLKMNVSNKARCCLGASPVQFLDKEHRERFYSLTELEQDF